MAGISALSGYHCSPITKGFWGIEGEFWMWRSSWILEWNKMETFILILPFVYILKIGIFQSKITGIISQRIIQNITSETSSG